MKHNLAWVLVLIQFTLLALLVVVAMLTPVSPVSVLWLIGGIFIVGGLVLVILGARDHTQTNQNAPQILPVPRDNADLVTTGLYARVRHPIYTGVLLSTFGVSLLHGHPLTLVVWLALVVLFQVKARYEESLLRQTYPTYDDYMTKTGRFLPRL